ncbi:MAG: SH3 domain-containing protein [Chloroflexota bacterium]
MRVTIVHPFSLLLMAGVAGAMFLGLPGQAQDDLTLPNRGEAPEIQSMNWINSETPLRLEALRGRVILLEFWTYDCINCIHTLPTIEGWQQTYADAGLQVLGIHFPELSWERDFQNVYAATQRLNVTYPVGIDNDGATWRAYGQRYWPTIYLIDREGNIRYTRFGEGGYEQTEQAIQALLAETTLTPETTPAPLGLDYLTPDTVLNVRAAPGTDSRLIGAIQPGMSFVILGEQDDWYEISYNDGTGFVSGEFVTRHDS